MRPVAALAVAGALVVGALEVHQSIEARRAASGVESFGETLHNALSEASTMPEIKIKRPDGSQTVHEMRGDETPEAFWERALGPPTAKAECWASGDLEITVTVQPQPGQTQEEVCDIFDSLVAEGMERAPKTGECEPQ